MRGALVSVALMFSSTVANAQACGSLPYTLTNGTNADATQVMSNFTALLNCINALPSPSGSVVPAQGRLTLATGAPVMTSSVTGAAVVYYTPYVGSQIAIYNGTTFIPTAFSELSNVTTNSSAGNAGPAAVVANSNYDLFIWSNSGSVSLTRGPAWTNDTTRSLALQRINGIWTNGAAIINGPGANLGTYVGTVRSDSSSQINWQPGAVAANGTSAILGVWNVYNRVDVAGLVGDTTDNWSYSALSWRAANASNTMRVSIVVGLQEDFFQASYTGATANTGGVSGALAGIGYDSTSAPSGRFPQSVSGNISGLPLVFNPQGSHAVQTLGFHFMQALEYGGATWYGDNGGVSQSGLTYHGRF